MHDQPLRSLLPGLHSYRRHLLLIGLCLALQTAYGALVPLSFRFLIDRAVIPRNWEFLIRLILVLAAASVVASVVAVSRDYLHAVVAAGVIRDLRSRMFRQLQNVSLDFYARAHAGDILARFSTDLAATETLLFTALPAGLGALASLALGLLLLFVLEWRLASVALLALLLCPVGPRLLGSRALAANAQAKQAVVAATSFVQEHLGAQTVVKAFGVQSMAEADFAEYLEATRATSVRAYFLGALVERTPVLGVWLLQLLIMGMGGAMALRGTFSIGSLVSFQALLLNVSAAVVGITEVIPALLRAIGGLQRIQDLLDEAPRIQDRPNAAVVAPLASEIEFRDITFGYTRGHPILQNVSFAIPAGTRIAVVGPNGSGKSSLVNLLMRFYDPWSGTVLWDGCDLRSITRSSLRAHIGAVLQDNFLFGATIRENIRLGRLEARDDEVEAAARAADVHMFIAGLPNGYDTVVGERGSRLSAGHRQRIAIARALLRRPDVLVLDEATSGVDAATEAAIMATLAEAMRARTLVTVTHRLGNTVGADRIFVMEHGHLVEQGTHGELLARGGVYGHLWHKQNAFTVDSAHGRARVDISWLHDVPILSALDEARLTEIADQFTPEGFLENRNVFQQGDRGDKFYIVARGTVEVVQQDESGEEQRIATLEDGDCFGEIALVQDVPRTATVRTVTPCVLLSLHRSHFLALLEEDAGMSEAVDALLLRAQPRGRQPGDGV